MEQSQNRSLYLAIIGPSGGGKGTQAQLLEDKFGFKHLSTGDLFRQEIANGTENGLKAKAYVEEGKWPPAELVFAVLRPHLEKAINAGFVLDGYPRSVDQLPLLENFLAEKGRKMDMVIWLRVSPEVIMSRRENLTGKGENFYKGQQRNDESPEAIKNRLLSYEKTIAPILDYCRQKNLLVELDGERPIEEIHHDILRIVNERQSRLEPVE